MTISKGESLLNQENPSAKEIQISITALEQERTYVKNCIEIGFRERDTGEATIEEISHLINKLEEKSKNTTKEE